MKISDLTLQYVKEFLRIDHDLDDTRITSHIAAAKSYIAAAHGYGTTEEMDSNECLTDMAMIIIQDLYDKGSIENQESISFLRIDRRF